MGVHVPSRRPFVRSMLVGPVVSAFGIALAAAASGGCLMSWDAPPAEGSPGGLDMGRKIRGSISGLAGSGLVLTNRDANDVTLEPGATSFEFLADKGDSYVVSVKAAPRSPVQDCVVANSVGTVPADEDVTDVVVVCTTLGFTLAADVSGLAGSLTLSDGNDALVVHENGANPFPPLLQGKTYALSVVTQPRAQRCRVAGGAGVMALADVLVPVRCIDSLVEGFDATAYLPAGWQAAMVTASGGAPWSVSNQGADSAPNCARVVGTATMLDTALVSPAISIVSDSPQARFRQAYEAEAGYDGGVLEIQIDQGPFVDIVAAGGQFASAGYTGMIGAGGLSKPPLTGRNAWTGSSGGYVTTVVNLPPKLAGKNVTLRWRWGNDDNNAVAGSGWRVDSLTVDR